MKSLVVQCSRCNTVFLAHVFNALLEAAVSVESSFDLWTLADLFFRTFRPEYITECFEAKLDHVGGSVAWRIEALLFRVTEAAAFMIGDAIRHQTARDRMDTSTIVFNSILKTSLEDSSAKPKKRLQGVQFEASGTGTCVELLISAFEKCVECAQLAQQEQTVAPGGGGGGGGAAAAAGRGGGGGERGGGAGGRGGAGGAGAGRDHAPQSADQQTVQEFLGVSSDVAAALLALNGNSVQDAIQFHLANPNHFDEMRPAPAPVPAAEQSETRIAQAEMTVTSAADSITDAAFQTHQKLCVARLAALVNFIATLHSCSTRSDPHLLSLNKLLRNIAINGRYRSITELLGSHQQLLHLEAQNTSLLDVVCHLCKFEFILSSNADILGVAEQNRANSTLLLDQVRSCRITLRQVCARVQSTHLTPFAPPHCRRISAANGT